MLRFVLAVIACVMLSACWQSEERFFDASDWARLNFSGEYDVASITDTNGPRSATLVSRPDGLIELQPQPADDEMPTLIGLVPITGGSGDYFLAMDRSSEGDSDTYYIAKVSNDVSLAFFFPDCNGTSAIEGMTAQASGFSETKTCTFTNEQALMKAALEAEKFLSAHHIMVVAPFLAFSRADDENAD